MKYRLQSMCERLIAGCMDIDCMALKLMVHVDSGDLWPTDAKTPQVLAILLDSTVTLKFC